MSVSKFSDDPSAIHFQIRFLDKDGGGSYRYFSALPSDSIGQKAELIANEYLASVQERAFCGYSNPVKIAQVVQYNRKVNRPVRGGIKFKVRLSVTLVRSAGSLYEVPSYFADEITITKPC